MPIVMTIISISLSVTAFYGGFNFAYLRFLKKFKPLNDHIVQQSNYLKIDNLDDNIKTLKMLNDFLTSIKVENEKVRFTDWYKQVFFNRENK